jgi:hypothetical protein
MTRKETTAIALKCFTIFILYRAFTLLPSLGTMAMKISHIGSDKPSNVVLYVVPVMTVLAMIFIAALVWSSANSVLAKETPPDKSSDLDVNGVIKIIFSCMGIYFIINALIYLPLAIADYQVAGDRNPLKATYLFSQVLKLIFGTVLVVKPGKWVKAIRSIGEI